MNQSEIDFHKDSCYKLRHFYYTQVLVLGVLLIGSATLYYDVAHQFYSAFLFLPITSIYLFISYKFGWSHDWRLSFHRLFLTMIGLIIFLPILLSIYYIIWNPTLSIKWFKTDNCSIIGEFTTTLTNSERYSLQYANFQDNLHGLSCVSNRKTSYSQMKGYDFYHRYD